jgi:hypothetical protein
MDPLLDSPPAIVGEAVAGQSAKRRLEVRDELKKLNNILLDSTFDVADLLAEIKENRFYEPDYETFPDFVEQVMDMKASKGRYLVNISQGTKALNIPRSKYATIKITKLREIFSLKTDGTYVDPVTSKSQPMAEFITALVDQANDLSLKEIAGEVKKLKGLVGDDELVWVNTCVKRTVRDNVIIPARELARQRLGSQGKDSTGDPIEYSDGACEEMICAEFLADPFNSAPEPDESEEQENNSTCRGCGVGLIATDVPGWCYKCCVTAID